MTRDGTDPPKVASVEEFERAVEELVIAAAEADIDVRGAILIEGTEEPLNYEVLVTGVRDVEGSAEYSG